MSHSVKDSEEWLKEAMSKIVENLGENVDEVQYETSKPVSAVMSTLYYVCVKFKNKTTNKNEEYSMLVKRDRDLSDLEMICSIDIQFNNEMLFYQMYTRPGDNFPRCFYVAKRSSSHNNSVIALENVSKRGYAPCPYKYNAPLEYILAAVKEMGRFHGKGYIMKEQEPEKFFSLVKRLEEPRYNNKYSRLQSLLDITATRAVRYLRTRDYNRDFCDKTEAFLSNAFEKVMMKTIEPLEPLSTICHGDFTLGNTLFKTEKDGQLGRAMLIDFGLLTYATPVIDLSTFLCLASSNELRKNKFLDILTAYYDELKTCLMEAKIQNIERYSYDALLNDYRRGALFGYVIASFYLMSLMGLLTVEFDKIIKMSDEESAKVHEECGGDALSEILADMLLHLKDLGCLKHIL